MSKSIMNDIYIKQPINTMSEQEVTIKEFFQEKFKLMEENIGLKIDNMSDKLERIDKKVQKLETETEVSRIAEKNPQVAKGLTWVKYIYVFTTSSGLLFSILKITNIL